MKEMLPCPFCGEKPSVRRYVDEDLWSHAPVEWLEVSCGECSTNFALPVHAIVPGDVDYDPETRWNTRK